MINPNIPQNATSALKRIRIGMIPVIVLMFIVIIPSAISIINTISGPCDNYHRYGVIMEDGTVRFIQGEYQYLSLDEIGKFDGQLAPGEEIPLCFDRITDEFIQACPYAIDQAAQDAALLHALMATFIPALGIIFVYMIICRLAPFGKAYYEYKKEQQQKEKEQIPVKVRTIICAVSIALALLITAPLIAELISNIQRYQRIQDRSDIIHGAEDAANEWEEKMDELEEALTNTVENEAIRDVSEAAENIWDNPN